MMLLNFVKRSDVSGSSSENNAVISEVVSITVSHCTIFAVLSLM